ncbi:uncharacterized protein LOC115454951 [Manduca sexta]|uniref:uncharacterized protein LOC115454951 n=1 Tax=Manduca sexta TaxID=7130 RepID=UPI00188EDF75|nr:uncharacterized protein LOC115454951 [Manduca sexta]
MDTPKLLSGEDLVTRGVTKTFGSLPEIGAKDVTPNGSWLEQKQIQAALEARKHLVEVERIEKFGTLSQAEWRDDLKLAEVTKQTGSYWQFFGHNAGKKLYLRSEEALFLMEVNCLQLKHNEITVSLQKAYSLLLGDEFSINQYKVYASLSRLGYKVFRHREINITSEKETQSEAVPGTSKSDSLGISPENEDDISNAFDKVENSTEIATEQESAEATIILDVAGKPHKNVEGENINEKENSTELTEKTVQENNQSTTKKGTQSPCASSNSNEEQDSTVTNKQSSPENNNNSGEKTPNFEVSNVENNSQHNITTSQHNQSTNTSKSEKSNKRNKFEMKIQKHQSRTLRAVKDTDRFYDELPEMVRQEFVYVNTPEDFYIPRNIFVNKTTYKLNLENLKRKRLKSLSTNSSGSDSEDEIRCLKKLRNVESVPPQNNNIVQLYPHLRLPRINQQFRPFLLWRPQTNFNFINFNTYHQRFQSQFPPRLHFFNRPNPFLRPFPNVNILDSNNVNDNSFRRAPKRPRNAKQFHLQAVTNLAAKVKNHVLSGNLVLPGNTQMHTVHALQKLLHAYNVKFNAKLRLSPQFELVDETNVVETIELDVEEETQSKKPRLEEDTFNENFNKLRLIAQKLRNLEMTGISTSSHRRALSAAIRTFNKSYNADVYLNDKYEMIDRRYITLDSSSDSECVVQEDKKSHKTKKLKNPFYILKHLSEKQSNGNASTSKDNTESEFEYVAKTNKRTSSCDEDSMDEEIDTTWWTEDNKLAKAELCSNNEDNLCVTYQEDELLYDFLKSHKKNYQDWVEIKIAFAKYLKQINKQYETEHTNILAMTIENQSNLRSIIGPEDCSDMPTLLKKLRIIKTNRSVDAESNVKIDFDVYNRDVPNFRKSNLPKPHFRVVCYSDSSKLPSGSDIASLHAKYDDKIPTVFAVVGVGSVSYLQINSVDLPVYLPTNIQ